MAEKKEVTLRELCKNKYLQTLMNGQFSGLHRCSGAGVASDFSHALSAGGLHLVFWAPQVLLSSFEWLFWLSLKSPSPPDVWMIVWWSHLKQIINWFNCEDVSNIKTRLCWCYVKLYLHFHCICDSSISVFCAGSLLWEESVQHIFPWTADLKRP